jgi:signal peptidase I
MKIVRTVVRGIREWTSLLVVTLVLFVLLRLFVVEAFTIPTASMERTLLVGDFLLVNKTLYGAEVPGTDVRIPAIREPRRGDVIVFRPPHDPHRDYVKRIVGMPGDTLSMRHKTLVVNGVPQDEPYARYLDGRSDAVHPKMRWQSDHLAAAGSAHGRYVPSRDNWGPIVVPPDRYFVLGDNRDNSEDSRYWGFVGREDIEGHPWLVYFSVRHPRDRRSGEGEGVLLERIRWSRIGQLIR